MSINITSQVTLNAAFKEFVLILTDTLNEIKVPYIISNKIHSNMTNIIGSAHSRNFRNN